MISTVSELQGKQVISTENGNRLGWVNDVKLDFETGTIVAIIISENKMFRPQKTEIAWQNVIKIGKETLIVNV